MSSALDRRGFLRAVGVGAAAGYGKGFAQSGKQVRVGVIGTGSRGVDMMRRSMAVPGVRITAVCDINEAAAAKAQNIVEEATGSRPIPYTRGAQDYKRLLERADVDAVLIMTPQNLHARQAVDAMLAGKHVGSETPSSYTIEDSWELVETKEKTGRKYMLLENYPYTRTRLMVLNMAHGGAMGEITYGESSYIHDTRNLAFEADGSLAWRGVIGKNYRGDVYPTHALGPISLWMGINRGDRLVSMVSMDTGTRSIERYAREKFGDSHPATKPGFFEKRDTTITLLRSEQEKLIVLRYDPGSNRPAGGWEGLQGTKGAYEASPASEVVFLEGRSQKGWEPLSKYRDEFEHPFWKADAESARRAGHGGGDFFVMREFYLALQEDREPPIDVYDGVTWSAILPLSGKCIREGNKAVEIPDFTRGKWRNRKMTGFGLG